MIYSVSRYLLLCSTVFFVGLLACRKDKLTIINGTVVDKHTGQPIENATVELKIYHDDPPLQNNDEYEYFSTDENGKFEFQSYQPFSINSILKSGYLLRGPGTAIIAHIEYGKENDVTIDLTPKDGVLKLNLENNTAQYDTIYVGMYSALQESEFGLSHGVVVSSPYPVQGISSQSKVFNLASEETVHIYWGSYPIASSHIQLAPNHDSVFVVRNDTTNFKISF